MLPLTRLTRASNKVFGTKQTTKAVQNAGVKAVYIAKDADSYVVDPLMKLCQEKGIEVVMTDTMEQLGKACNIDVGAASAVIIED